MTSAFPWYDSWWLASYVAAKDLVTSRYPDHLDGFVASFDPLRTRPDFTTVEIPAVLDAAKLAELHEVIGNATADSLEKHEFFRFGRHVIHDHPVLDRLQREFIPLVAELAGEAVEPAYNFLSLYNSLGICELHMDAPNAKWTLDVCIDQSAEWPLQIGTVCPWPEGLAGDAEWEDRVRNDRAITFTDYCHQVGSGLLFSGSSQWHERNRIAQGGAKSFAHLAFFHYAPVGVTDLLKPRHWAAYFGIPELAEVIVLPRGFAETARN